MSEFRPTLLVGVGGTGCRVVEKILGRVAADNKELAGKIGALCFDTDVNDISKLKRLGRREVVQFSRPETIYRLLDRNPDVEGAWFPNRKDHPQDGMKGDPRLTQELLGTSLIDGAAQVRMLTRLALTDSLTHGDIMEKMEGAIARLAVHSQEHQYDGNIHILMFGSLAGATGSGSFFQIALALRNASRQRSVSATVRGLFLMPDVFIQGGSLPRGQIPNLLANGYASLKELNAINVLVSRPNRPANFSFSYMPGEDIRSGEMPFEAFTIVDYEAAGGGNMGKSLGNYEEMAARAGYLLIFSPLGARYSSITINDVRAKLAASAAGTHNLYSSVGVAAIAYPIDSMRDYLKQRLIVENLRGDWTRLDRNFRDRMRSFQKQEAAGGTQDVPDITKEYVTDLRDLANQNVAFFERIQKALNPEIKDEDTHDVEIKPLHRTYLDALNENIRTSFWLDDKLEEVAARPLLDVSNFKNKATLSNTVRQAENNLDTDYRLIETELRSRPETLFRNTLLTADDMNEQEWRAHHIQSYLIKGGPHPVQIRAFLYLTRQAIIERQGQLDSDKARKELFLLSSRFYDDEERKRIGGNPSERGTTNVVKLAQEASKSGFLGGLIGSSAEEFSEGYVQYFNTAVEKMRHYAHMMIEEKVLALALEEVDAMIKAFTGLFVEIEEVTKTLERALDREEKRYASGAQVADGSVWVYADASCKQDAWERLQDMAAGLRLDASVNQKVAKGVYDKYREDRRKRRESGFRELNRMFMTEVVENFGGRAIEEDFAGAYDFSVIEAIRRQVAVEEADIRKSADDPNAGDLSDEDIEEQMQAFLRRAVDRVARQSEPYILLENPDSDGQPIKFWAINPKCREDLNNEGFFIDAFQFKQGDNPIVEADFSPYELTCVNLRVNLKLENMKKLHHGSGADSSIHATSAGRLHHYYKKMVDQIIASDADPNKFGGEFTPHIDQTWHKRGLLPEIFVDQEAGVAANLSKGYVAALTLGLLRFEQDYGKPLTRFSTQGKRLRDPIDVDLAETHDPWDVYGEFRNASHLVDASLAAWEQVKVQTASSFEAHNGTKALLEVDPVARIFELSAKRVDIEKRDRALGDAIDSWIDLVSDLIETQRSDMGATGRALLLRETIEGFREKLFEGLRLATQDPQTLRVYESEFDKAYDRRFTQ